MIHKFPITVPPLTGETTRTGYIYIPDTYNKSQEKRYPVMYMFDGHNVFFDEDATYGKSWVMAAYLEANPKELIIIAIECNHDGSCRLSEYSPFDFSYEPFGEIKAKGKVYMDWLVDTLKPEVDSHLKTLPDRNNTIICGSSMGGLMSLYGATVYNKYFSRAACLSPSLWINPEKLEHMIDKSKINQDTCIYMDYGSRELNNHEKSREILLSSTSLLINKNANVTLRIIHGGTHSEASWAKQVPVFMECLGL